MNQPMTAWNHGQGDAGASAQAAVLPMPDFRASKTSYIETHEIAEANALVEAEWLKASGGKPLKFRPCGYKILVKLYVRPEELELGDSGVKLKLVDQYRAEDKFQSCTGLVLAMGDQCYTGTARDGSLRYPNGPWCRTADWICVDRYAGKRVTINGVACMIVNDDAIDGVIDEPADIQAGHVEFKA